MDKNFIQYQASSIKKLIDLFDYKFTSDGNEYKLIDFVKSQLLSYSDFRPYVSELLNNKSLNNKDWFKNNISPEYVDVLFQADNYDEVALNFVTLYNSYVLYKNDFSLLKFDKYNSWEILSEEFYGDANKSNIIDTQNVGFVYNPELSETVKAKNEIDFSSENIERYRDILSVFKNSISYYTNDKVTRTSSYSIVDKDRDRVVVSEPLKSIIINQTNLKGVIPLQNNFYFHPEDATKQVAISVRADLDYSEYKSDVTDVNAITENITVFNEVNKLRDIAKSNYNSSNGLNYIDEINKMTLIKSKHRFYAIASLKDRNSFYANTAVNLVFNRDKTISAMVDGYDFYYTLALLCKVDSGITFDIYYDADNKKVVFLGEKRMSVKTPSGFNATTMQVEYSMKDVYLTITLPVIETYPNIIDEVWLFSYSLSTKLADIIEYTKEVEEISKIKIPTEFLNQKDIISKEQLFKIETIEEKIKNIKVTGKALLDKAVGYIEDYILTYCHKKQIEIKDNDGNIVSIKTIYEPNTTDKKFFIQGSQINYDYIWKVNELFWRYNSNLSIIEMIAYFVAKGDDYYYRLLSYRILGVDCYLFKDMFIEPLLIDGSLCIEDFAINVQLKNIEKPLSYSYKYEYATGNYYEKRKKLFSADESTLDNLAVYPMRESIILYYGRDLGENIMQNQLSLLEDKLVKPSEMTWNSKTEKNKLLSSPLDPIFLTSTTTYIRNKSGYRSLVVSDFYDFLGSTRFTNDQVTRRDLLFGYILRLPESVSIPLQFINEFNCFKIAILSGDSPKNSKSIDVFAVFGSNDTKNENPLFLGNDSANSQTCKDYIKSKPFGGSIKFMRRSKMTKKGRVDLGTYSFSKSLKYLQDNSYTNLFEGGFISQDELSNKIIVVKNTKKIVAEILIAFNSKQPKVIIEGDIQFNKYMNAKVDDLDALKMQQMWNERYNYAMYPKQSVMVEGFNEVLKLDNSKFPIFIEHSRFFKDENSQEFLLNDNQIDGIKFHVGNDNSSLLAHEVGFGKTTTSICSLTHNFLTGKANRTMISVPNPTYINWISEMRGQVISDTKKLRGLIPHINIVELKNARKDVFLQYDTKTFTQTGGIKKYTNSQIGIIHNFADATLTIVSEITQRVKNIYFVDYEGKIQNYESLVKFVEKTFDVTLTDWRMEAFFSDYFAELDSIRGEYEAKFNDKISIEKDLENNAVERIDDNLNMTQAEKDIKISSIREKAKKKKNKIYEALVKEFTNQVVAVLKSKQNSIFDIIGVYEECFLRKYSVVICTHEAISQLRINKSVAQEVSIELKDDLEFASDLEKNAIGFDKLDIDSIIVDEVHNFNELFSYSKRQISKLEPRDRRKQYFISSDYSLNSLEDISSPRFAKKARGTNLSSVIKFNLAASKTSVKKSSLFGICKTLQNNYQNKKAINIMLLSATPFVDNLFQMIGVFNMVRPFPLPINFFSNYLYQEWDWENDHKGETVLKVQTSNFKNHDARNNWIRLYSQFYTFDQRINAKRPNKFVYPYDCKNGANQYEDNCNSSVYLNFSDVQYSIYKNIGKFVDGVIGRDNIIKATLSSVSITKEPYLDADDIKFVKEDLINQSSPNYDLETATTIFIHNNWFQVLLDTKNQYNKDISDIYEVIKEQYLIQTADEEDVESSVDDDGEVSVQDINDESEISGNGCFSFNDKDDNISDAGTRALQAQDLGKKLSLSPYMVTAMENGDNLFKDSYINSDLPPLYGMNNAENMIKSAINFVETSPKIYFCVKSIECLIKKHIENEEDISGQIIYMAWGQSFWYGGYRYNGMELIKAYLENSLGLNKTFDVEESDELSGAVGDGKKCGSTDISVKVKKEKIKSYNLSEIQIVSGEGQDALKKSAISKAFNDGRIKVLIGSGTIKEGINLQGAKTHGNSTIYVLTAEYAPMSMMQLEGRIWRQGNPLENVRMVYPLIKNSIDAHIYSKLNEKIKKVKNMLEAGIYDFKETQFDKDIEGVSLALNTNIEEKIKILWGKETRSINKETATFDSFLQRLENVKEKYNKSISSLDDLVSIFNPVSKAVQDYYLSIFIRNDYRIESANIKDKFKAERVALVDSLNKVYDDDLSAWEDAKEDNEKINKENEKKNKANDKLIKEGKAKKIAKIDFTLDKPLKKDEKYQPDYTVIDMQEENAMQEAKQRAIDVNLKKAEDRVFTDDEIIYYTPINISMAYSDISATVNKLLSQLAALHIFKMSSDELIVLNGRIKVSGYYWVLDSKGLMVDYNYTTALEADSLLASRMAATIKENNMQNASGGFSLFKDFCKLFTGGGAIESVLSDYQSLVTAYGKDITTIDDLITDYEVKIREYNDKLNNQEAFFAAYRTIFIEQEEKINKERESLTNMKQFVLLDVNKFCETNKFIYIKGSLSEEEKKLMFKIKE